MATFNPTAAELQLLSQIRARESSNNYQRTVTPADCLKLTGGTNCTASGAYMFTDSTWNMAAQATGAGLNCANAASCSQDAQDTNALWLLRHVSGDPNASIAWYASGCGSNAGCYPTTGQLAQATGDGVNQPLVDISGDGASTSTASLLDQLQAAGSNVTADVTSISGVGIALAVGVPLVAYFLFS